MSIFTWQPSFNVSVTEEPRTLNAAFGDGYEQRVADGINTTKKIWNLQFNNRLLAEANAIVAFLRARGAVESFTWTDPDGDTLKYICRNWPRSFYGLIAVSFTLTFEQVFGE